MKCPLCGYEFDEAQAQQACSGCSLLKKCELVRCPNCNFETAPEPEWIKKFRGMRRKKDATIG